VRARADLARDLCQVVAELPGEDLVPLPGPLGPGNEVYWGSCHPLSKTISSRSARLSRRLAGCAHRPVLLSRLMVVLAKHLAAAGRGRRILWLKRSLWVSS
jgi:hypothetical protein